MSNSLKKILTGLVDACHKKYPDNRIITMSTGDARTLLRYNLHLEEKVESGRRLGMLLDESAMLVDYIESERLASRVAIMFRLIRKLNKSRKDRRPSNGPAPAHSE
jgi:hypothetical protein